MEAHGWEHLFRNMDVCGEISGGGVHERLGDR